MGVGGGNGAEAEMCGESQVSFVLRKTLVMAGRCTVYGDGEYLSDMEEKCQNSQNCV